MAMDSEFRPIKRLSQDDVDRIAAGEIIQRPKNAVKELLENSLDAGATKVEITVKYSGKDFKIIKIKDNGCGMSKEDLPLACERFATSKLENFEQLATVTTFGFRGEALASISRISNLSIISRTKSSILGYTMEYENGQPKSSEPKLKTSDVGTTIVIKDLFHNCEIRKNTLKAASEEYKQINELVSLYSLDNTHVSFRLSRENASGVISDDIKTTAGEKVIERIKNVMGSRVAADLLPLKIVEDSLKFKATGLFGDLNSKLRSYKIVIFINNRLVECAPLKKSITNMYKTYMPKGSCPLVLLSLEIRSVVDVNIHPTKDEVRFDYEEGIISTITNYIESFLTSSSSSKIGPACSSLVRNFLSRSGASSSPSRPDLMNRSNPNVQTVEAMFSRQITGEKGTRRTVNLTSVLELRDEVEEQMSEQFKMILKDATFVGYGVHNNPLVLMQSERNLLSIPLQPLTEELFYQMFLVDFANFGVIELTSKPTLAGLLRRYGEEKAKLVTETLMQRRGMMDDYFSLVIDADGCLTGIPIVVNKFIPDFDKLPNFLLEVGMTVDWSSEKECFQSFGRCLARFYSMSRVSGEINLVEKLMKYHLFPLIQKTFKPSTELCQKLCSFTNNETLYKVFLRC